MIILVETMILCSVFFLLCYLGTGSDEKNLRSYSSYPDKVQDRMKSMKEYQGRFKENNRVVTFLSNFLLFLVVLFVFGLITRKKNLWHNFLALSVMGQGLNLFDLFVIDLLWWRNTKRIRFTKIPEKELYQNPRKHMEAFGRAFVMYLLVAFLPSDKVTMIR